MKRIAIVVCILAFVGMVGAGSWLLVYRFVLRDRQGGLPPVSDREVARLLGHFADTDDDKALEASQDLAAMGERAVDPLRATLKVNNPRIRFWAVQTLAFMDADTMAPATDDLLPLLRDDDVNVRYKTVYALGKVHRKSEAAFVGIVNALADPDESVRDTAIEVVEKLDKPPKGAVPALAKLVAPDANAQVRQRVLPILAKAGEPAVPTFRELLKKCMTEFQPRSHECSLVLHATSLLGPAAHGLLPELDAFLLQTVRSPHGVEHELLEALKKCGPDGAKCMAEAIEGTVPQPNRQTVLAAIGGMGAEAKTAVPILAKMLKDAKPSPIDYRGAVLEALGNIGPAARDAASAVEPLLQNSTLAGQARETLNRMGIIAKK